MPPDSAVKRRHVAAVSPASFRLRCDAYASSRGIKRRLAVLPCSERKHTSTTASKVHRAKNTGESKQRTQPAQQKPKQLRAGSTMQGVTLAATPAYGDASRRARYRRYHRRRTEPALRPHERNRRSYLRKRGAEEMDGGGLSSVQPSTDPPLL